MKADPTKGSWGHHEDHSLKAYYAGTILMLEAFMVKQGLAILNEDKMICDETLWKWQHAYHDFAQSMMICKCGQSKTLALYMDLICHWELCRQSVVIDDFMVMEV